MTHLLTAETLHLLQSYFVSPERKAIAFEGIRQRTRSRKMRRSTRSGARVLPHRDEIPISAADFSDPESERVLDAIADALIGPLALQAARDDDEAEWLANQQGRQ